MSDELDRLIAEQKTEDQSYQAPQVFGKRAIRTIALDKFSGGNPENVRTSGVWNQQKLSPLPPRRRARSQRDRWTMYRVCDDLLQNTAIAKAEAVRLVVYAQFSLREAAKVLNITHQAVEQRLKSAFAEMRQTLSFRSGSDSMRFVHRLSKLLTDGYARKYEVAEHEESCEEPGCITILSRYNLSSLCRVHSRNKLSEAEFNMAYILGAVKRGGQDVRSTTAP